MEKVILCNGSYAKNPYSIESNEINIYSVEELCYFLYKHAFVIQEDFFTDELIQWMEDECELKEWAEHFRKLQKEDADLIDYLEFLFRNTGFYGEQEIENVKKVLSKTHHLSLFEKRKLRADALLKRGRITVAAMEYEKLLYGTDEKNEKDRACLYHNLGVCDARLFQYKKAAEEFWRAYRIYPNTESYLQFLSAMKLGSSKQEYLSYLADHPESYEDSLEVERRMSKIEMDYKNQYPEDRVAALATQSGMAEYETVIELSRQAREDYLKMIRKD